MRESWDNLFCQVWGLNPGRLITVSGLAHTVPMSHRDKQDKLLWLLLSSMSFIMCRSWTWSQAVFDGTPEHSEELLTLPCGSVNSLLDRLATESPLTSDGRHDTARAQDQEDQDEDAAAGTSPPVSSSGYCELQLAVAMQWTSQQRRMILLEQLIHRQDDVG